MGFFSDFFEELDRFIVCCCRSNQTTAGLSVSYRYPRRALTGAVRGPLSSPLMATQSSALTGAVHLPRAQDDAAGRRLGNGAKFYGKRRSSFYGEEDTDRKADPDAFDAEEDWRGPQGGSYFVPSPEKDERGRPLGFLTRREARELQAKEREAKYAREGEDLVGAFRKATEEDRAE